MAADLVQAMELAVQLTGFRNVDLFSQGIYQLRVSAKTERSGRPAVPLSIVDAPEAASTDMPADILSREFLLPAHILHTTCELCSPAFRVRYCEEEVLLRQLARMRVDIPSSPAKHNTINAEVGDDLLVIVNLMHCRSTTILSVEKSGESVEALSTRHFSVAATQVCAKPTPSLGRLR